MSRRLVRLPSRRWVDERLYADVSLDVYQIPSMRSPTEHYPRLKRELTTWDEPGDDRQPPQRVQ